jgi:uncharacterized protein YcsI (UPF0317 family)
MPLGDVTGDDENVPIFWACGVTPQEAVVKAVHVREGDRVGGGAPLVELEE